MNNGATYTHAIFEIIFLTVATSQCNDLIFLIKMIRMSKSYFLLHKIKKVSSFASKTAVEGVGLTVRKDNYLSLEAWNLEVRYCAPTVNYNEQSYTITPLISIQSLTIFCGKIQIQTDLILRQMTLSMDSKVTWIALEARFAVIKFIVSTVYASSTVQVNLL